MEISGSIATPSQGTQAPGAQALPEGVPAPAQQRTQPPPGATVAPTQGQPPAQAPAAAPAPVALDGAPADDKVPNPDTSNTYSYEPRLSPEALAGGSLGAASY